LKKKRKKRKSMTIKDLKLHLKKVNYSLSSYISKRGEREREKRGRGGRVIGTRES
jgi:hypothetical protein